MMTDKVLDVRGLSCPLPVLRAKKTLDTLPPGTILTVIATDPGTRRDFESLCRQTGHTLLKASEDGELFTFILQRAG
ncbi:sulfurtransferase TusA family protein [Magnetospirillum molischianum]|uniref:UPF0033 domain-containing protein n=1 Tax=Magnetospirillum molischianum DSM 120 TaxID=1150626 RepID=H8FQW3_MAGML|nr:sulfurtransferase TusA family protein [Magnetospirillum molischianum]CCG40751.1 conserved hypothetical protein [Magnetospirillum molischianum DSM 120]